MKLCFVLTRILAAIILSAGLAVPLSVRGATVAWLNAAGGNWNNSTNWANHGLPGPNDDVVINLASTNLLVTYTSGSTTVRSVQCTGAFLLAGGSLTVTAGASQFSGPLTIAPGGALDVDGAQTSLAAQGPTAVDGAALSATRGAQLSLPRVATYQQPGGCGSLSWVASGAGSVLSLPGLSNLTGGNCGALVVQAFGGGNVLLNNVSALGDGNFSAYAEGTDSVVDLSALKVYHGTNFSFSVEAKAGGKVLLPQFEEGTRVNITLDAGGFVSTDQIKRLAGLNLAVNGGSELSLPNVTSYQEPPGCGTLSWVANGPGTVLNLPGLTNLTGGNCGALSIQALGGGQVLLSNLVTMPEGNVSVYAEGTASLVDLSALPEYRGTNFTFSIQAKAGGRVLIPELTEASRVDIALDGTGFISTTQIKSMSSASLTASGGAALAFPAVGEYQEPAGCGTLSWVASGAGSVLNLPGLTNLTGGNCGALVVQAYGGGTVLLRDVSTLGDGNLSAYAEGTNSVVDLSGVTVYHGTNFSFSVEAKAGGKVLLPQFEEGTRVNITLDGGGFVSTDQIKRLDGLNLAVNGGSELSLPNVTSYQEPPGCGALTWVANGPGTVLNLPGLTNLTGGNCGALSIQALGGGQVLLSNLVTMPDGNVSVYAEGTGSLVDLSALPEYRGTNFTFSIQAKAGGRVLIPELTEASRVDIALDGTGFISSTQIKSLSSASLTASGGAALAFPGVGEYQEPAGCGTQSWVASGAGSVLSLPGLTNLTGGNCGALSIQAVGGGQVGLQKVTTLGDGNLSVDAEGTNSVVDLSSLPAFNGASFVFSVTAKPGGTVLLPQFATARRVSIAVDGNGFISTGPIRSLAGANLTASGGAVLSLAGAGSYEEPTGCGSWTWLATGAGSVLSLKNLTNLVGGDCGTLNVQATAGGQIALDSLISVTGGNVGMLADGTNTFLDLSRLVSYQGTNHTLAIEARNRGTVDFSKLSTVSAGTVQLTGAAAKGVGNVEVFSGATLNAAGELQLDSLETISSRPGAVVKIGGNLLGATRNADRYSPLGKSEFVSGPHQLEAMSRDLGNVPTAYVNNFAYGAVVLDAGAQVTLVDQAVNSSGPSPESVYINSLVVPATATLDLKGLHLYARLAQIAGTLKGGTISQAPENGGPIISGPGIPARLSTAGALDAYTFFGRAGQAVAVAVTLNSPDLPPPPLNFALVQLIDPLTNLVAQASNTVAQPLVAITGVTLPRDGTYTVQVHAPGNQPGSVGNYEVAVWFVQNTVAQLPLNQLVHGSIQSPFDVDQWSFSAAAGEQIRFKLANVSAPGLVFDLSGPNGWSGFSNLVTSSDLITLPASGGYTLTARGTGGAYNLAYAFEVDQTVETPLALGTTATGQFTGNSQAQLFVITVTNAAPLLINLNNTGANNATELYVKRGSPPTRGVFDAQSANSASANQQILIPQAVPGTYYVLVYGNAIPTPGSYSIEAQAANLFLTSATPGSGAHDTTLTMTLTGAGFLAGSGVELAASSGTSFPASSVAVDSFTQITATFLSNTVPAGTYSVVVAEGVDRASLTNALTIAASGAANLETKLILPSALGRHAVATLYVEYANTGNVAMPAPLLVLQGTGPTPTIKPVLTLDASRVVQNFWSSVLPPGTGNKVFILGSGAQAGVLNPGERIQVPVYYLGLQQPWDFNQSTVSMGIRYWTADNPNSIDWSAREAAFRPPTLDSTAWHIIYSNITAPLTNNGAYVRMLDNAAQFLSRLGERVVDVASLWNFALQQANGFQAVPVLDTAVDASLPTPGIPLQLNRHYSSSVAARNSLGPFGRGWFTPWQMSLVVQNNGGLVELLGEGGSARIYTLDSRSGNYFSSAGDSTTLRAVNGGVFEVNDTDGNVTRFRADGRVDYVVDPNGNKVSAEYDGTGHLTALTHSSGSSLSFTYNAAGLVGKVSDSAGRFVAYSYDGTGPNLLTVTTDDGKITTYTYQTGGSPAQAGALASVTRAGVTRSFTFDIQGRVASTSLPSGAQLVQFNYDPAGAVTVNDGQGTTSLYFDYRGLLAKITDPLGNSTTAHFDDNLRLAELVSPTGASKQFAWCTCGSLSSLADELGETTTFQHDDPFNRLTVVSDPRGNTTAYTYDGQGNLLETTFPDNSTEQFTQYSATGQPHTYLNRRRQGISQTYTASGQVATRSFGDGSEFGFQYDGRGNLLAATNHLTSGVDQITRYTYNYASDGDRVRQITYPDGRWVALSYDHDGRRQQVADASGQTNTYSYDLSGRLAQVSDGSSHVLVSYVYTTTGRLQRVNKANGTFSTYTYDAAGNVRGVVNSNPSGATNSFFNYTYDSRGRRTSVSIPDGEWSYAYDVTGRLLHATFDSSNAALPDQDLQYAYDAAGNRTTVLVNGHATNYVANSLNEYTSFGTTVFQYDADGNLLFDGVNTYQYDAQNAVLSVSGPAGLTQFEYDALGNRTASILNGQRSEYLVDPAGNVLADYDASGHVSAQNVYGLGLAGRGLDASRSWYDFDALGSVAGISGEGGNYVNQYHYLPFGGLLASSGPADNPYTFDGSEGMMSDSSGLLLTPARAYQPNFGRFNSIDPLRLNGGKPNDYTYAANDPVLLTDPSGRCFVIGGVNGGPNNFVGFSLGTSTGFGVGASAGAGVGVTASVGPGGILGPAVNAGLASGGAGAYAGAGVGVSAGAHVGASLGYSQGSTYGLVIGWGWGGGCPPPGDITIVFPCDDCDDGGGDGDGGDDGDSGTADSHDPNELLGPAGYAAQNYVLAAGNLFVYEIVFENMTNATAPAQQVQITDVLSTNLDWSTFQLREVAFGDRIIVPPAQSQHFETNVTVVYQGVSFEVDIAAGLRPGTGEVFANFLSIDPLTSLPPAVNIGFLPPEDGTGRGIGHVSYSVRPKPNLATGLQITNVALIQFDVNPVIATDQADPNDPSKGLDPKKQALVTIDSAPPVSAVLPLPATEPSTNFIVLWSGTDVGSGIVSYDIFAADNGDGWQVWLAGTTNTSAMFEGQNGHNYSFYSLARDGAGNVEQPPASADASTTVNTSAAPPLSIAQAMLPNGEGVQITLSFAVKAGATYVVEYRDDLSPGTSWHALPGAPHNSGTVTDTITNSERYYRLRESP